MAFHCRRGRRRIQVKECFLYLDVIGGESATIFLFMSLILLNIIQQNQDLSFQVCSSMCLFCCDCGFSTWCTKTNGIHTHLIIWCFFFFFFITKMRNQTWHNNITAQGADLPHPVCFGLFSAVSEVSHLNMLIAVNRQKRRWHMLLSQPTSTAPTTLFLPPPPFEFTAIITDSSRTNRYPPISAAGLRPLWTSLFARKCCILALWQERVTILEPRLLWMLQFRTSPPSVDSLGKLPVIQPTSGS